MRAPCATPTCGDGVLSPGEACDDGNAAGDDGCSADCAQVEAGWHCPLPGAPCVPVCGDGIIAGSEECDDGNAADGDGCSSRCLSESGPHRCGDGIVSGAEECDCGVAATPPARCLAANADGTYGGCTTACKYGPFCGDGHLDPDGGEQCDLGRANQTSYATGPTSSQCSPACQIPHYCGDGQVDTTFGEACDLGPANGHPIDLGGTLCIACDQNCEIPVGCP